MQRITSQVVAHFSREIALALSCLIGAGAFVAPAAACPECEKLARAAVAADGTGTKWSDPTTWSGGKLPQEGQAVVIPAGRKVLLDVAPPRLKSLLIKGELRWDRRDLELNVGWILVIGPGSLLEIGSEAEPFRQRAAITFFGTDEQEKVLGDGLLGTGTKFLCAMEGGRLELHGAHGKTDSWTQLAAHARPGDQSLTLAAGVAWRPGDQICIAPSGYSPLEAERVTVTAAEGNRVRFEPPLAHHHWGERQTIEGRVVDERAEVGLLTRNIVLRGGPDSEKSRFGGHMMIMPGGTAHIEGVEFFRMGQAGHQARYALHWHLVDRLGEGDAPGKGQYARNNSIHGSYQRAIVIHGTNDVLVEGNVAYDVTNHCYIPAEDGDEENNVFRRNLGMLVRSPEIALYAFPGKKLESSDQNEAKSSVFWMTNPNQVFEGNHAAGSLGGDGFLFNGVVKGRAQPGFKQLVFCDNVAHSNQRKDKLLNGLVHYGAGVQNFGLTFDRVSNVKRLALPEEVGTVRIENFTAYKNAAGGVWLESQRELLVNSILADHYVGAQFGGGGGCLENVLIVRRTANGLGEEHLAREKEMRAPSTGLYLENGAARILTKNLTFVGMDISTYGYRRDLEAHQRIGWRFADVKNPVYSEN